MCFRKRILSLSLSLSASFCGYFNICILSYFLQLHKGVTNKKTTVPLAVDLRVSKRMTKKKIYVRL